MDRRFRQVAFAAAALLLAAIAAVAQRGRGGFRPPASNYDEPMAARAGEFHFLRVEYVDIRGRSRGFGYSSREGMGSGWWMMDWPAAENHFTTGVERLTRIQMGDPRHVRLTDPRLFDYPWIYATQTAWWDLSDAEVLRLREYLLRGGFLVTDDFWGLEDWELVRRSMERVLPGQPITDISPSDPVMHVLYDIQPEDLTAIPGSRHLRAGASGRPEIVLPQGEEPAWRAMYDPKRRMVVAVNFNTDIGDAWEFADVPYYPAEMTLLAYRYGINYVIYAMTH